MNTNIIKTAIATVDSKQTALTACAARVADALWVASMEAPKALADTVVELLTVAKGDCTIAGTAIAEAWRAISGNVEGHAPVRLLVEACAWTSLTKEETGWLVQATALVSRQRVAQLLAVVYDGDTSKNSGKQKAQKDKREGKTPKAAAAQEPLAVVSAMPAATADTHAEVLAALMALAAKLDRLSAAEASALAKLLQSKMDA